MKQTLRTLALLAALLPGFAAAQTAPANMPYHTLWGRLGARVGDTGPASAIPFTNVQSSLLSSICTNLVDGAYPLYSATSGAWICSTAATSTDNSYFTGGVVGIGDIVATAVASPPQTPLPQITIARAVNWASINYDNIRDLSIITPQANGTTFDSFDVSVTANGSFNYTHLASFQDRMGFGGSGTLDEQWGFFSRPNIASGTLTNRRGVYIWDPAGVGTITNNYGIYVNAQTRGSTLNYGWYTDGTNPNFSGGNITIGVASPASGTSRALALNGAAAGTAAGTGVVGQNGASVVWGVGNTSSLIGGAYDATLMFSSSTSAYRFNGLTAGLFKASSNGTVSITAEGTGVDTALSVNVGTAGAFVVNGGVLGTPSSGVATNLTGTAAGLTAGAATTATTATNATNVGVTNDTTTNATMFPLWVTANTGNLPAKVTSTKLSFNPSTGTLTSTALTGSLAGSTGLPVSTGLSGAGTGVLTALGTNMDATGGICTYTFGTFSPTVTTSGTVGTPAYAANGQVGSYEKCGRMVKVQIGIALSGWTGSPTGNVSIAGLPFTSANVTNDTGSCFANNYVVAGLTAGSTGVNGLVNSNSTTLLLVTNGNTAAGVISAAQAGTTMNVNLTCLYHT